LLDTNIFLEVILDQQRSGEARALLSKVEEHELFLSDYSLHSIGLLLFRRGQHALHLTLHVSHFTPYALHLTPYASRFNSDFDRTEKGRKTPKDLLKSKK